MKIALMYSENNFVGPEYYYWLAQKGIALDFLISVGRFSENQVKFEINRTNGLWKRKQFPENVLIEKFESHNDHKLWEFILNNKIDLVIQGGVGFIFTQEMINLLSFGIINVHPGKLPEYRGCSAPEWAIYNSDEVFITAHIIDNNIDTGPIIKEKVVEYRKYDSYPMFRANIYKECAFLLIDAIKIIKKSPNKNILTSQDKRFSKYWERIGENELAIVKNKFKSI